MEKKINGKPIDKSRNKKNENVVCCCKKKREIYNGNLSLYQGNINMLFMTSSKT